VIVYGSNLSPFVRKVLVICAEKGIEVENPVFGPGVEPSDDFRAASPFRRIPAICDGDFALADSSAIAHYLDAAYPEPRLIPAGPKAMGRVVWFDEMADTIVFGTGVKIFFNRVVAPLLGQTPDLELARRAEAEEMPEILAYLDRVAPEEGWLVGESFTLADIAVGAPFVNYALAGRRVCDEAYPRLCAYLERVHARPSFAAIIAANRGFLDRFKDRLQVAA
jgi:glutathione S-transferase